MMSHLRLTMIGICQLLHLSWGEYRENQLILADMEQGRNLVDVKKCWGSFLIHLLICTHFILGMKEYMGSDGLEGLVSFVVSFTLSYLCHSPIISVDSRLMQTNIRNSTQISSFQKYIKKLNQFWNTKSHDRQIKDRIYQCLLWKARH